MQNNLSNLALYQFSSVGHGLVGVSEGVDDKVGVAVNGHVQDQGSSVALGGNKVADSFHLGFGEGARTGVGETANVIVVVG
jgi:hypothetical protein